MRKGSTCNATCITHHWIARNTLDSLNRNGYVNHSEDFFPRPPFQKKLFSIVFRNNIVARDFERTLETKIQNLKHKFTSFLPAALSTKHSRSVVSLAIINSFYSK